MLHPPSDLEEEILYCFLIWLLTHILSRDMDYKAVVAYSGQYIDTIFATIH